MKTALVKTILISSAILFGYRHIIERIESFDSIFPSIAFISLFFFYFSCAIATAFIPNAMTRIVFAVTLASSFLVYEASQRIFGEALTYSAFITLVNSRGFLFDTLEAYRTELTFSLLQTFLLFAGISYRGKFVDRRWTAPLSLAPILAVTSLSTLMFFRGGEGAKGLPSMFTVLSYATLYAYEEKTMIPVERSEISLALISEEGSEKNPRSRAPRDIVLIVDESIRGDYLDINSPLGVTTNLDEVYPNLDIFNYGLAVSPSNCSDASNLIYRFGGQRGTFREYTKSMPSIWQYAANAGYTPVYIDSQRTGGEFHNGMTESEAEHIETIVQFDRVHPIFRDHASLNQLTSLLKNNRNEFIYLNKIGGHFPVRNKYPKEYRIYEPALPMGSAVIMEDKEERTTSGGWKWYKNSYKNTLSWNVGKFFDGLLKSEGLRNALIIYTADHGQNFHDRGEPGVNTHCSITPSIEEGVVPLVAMVGKDLARERFARSSRENHDRTSLFSLFPTLLDVLGYSIQDTTPLYGTSIFSSQQGPLSFNYTFHLRLGAADRFKLVDLSRIRDLASTSAPNDK